MLWQLLSLNNAGIKRNFLSGGNAEITASYRFFHIHFRMDSTLCLDKQTYMIILMCINIKMIDMNMT